MPDAVPLPPVTLCADDFALSHGISRTIADLAGRGCINAISCMAAMPGWAEDSRLLDGIEEVRCGPLGRVQVGLHLVLASERPLGAMRHLDKDGRLPGPDRMLALALLGQLDRCEIAAEIDRQFYAFHAERGGPPDFVDAHQHVHVYPGIRRAVIAATRKHAPKAWVRVPDERIGAMLARPFAGKAIGSTLHAAGFRGQLARAGLRANGSFAGHYDFREPSAALLDQFLRHGSNSHLVMCHPGSADLPRDDIAAARRKEAEIIGRMTLAQRWSALQPAGRPRAVVPAHG